MLPPKSLVTRTTVERYKSSLSLTSTQDAGGWSTPRPGRFTPWKDPVPIVQESGWAPGPVRTDAENVALHRVAFPGPSSPWRVAYALCLHLVLPLGVMQQRRGDCYVLTAVNNTGCSRLGLVWTRT